MYQRRDTPLAPYAARRRRQFPLRNAGRASRAILKNLEERENLSQIRTPPESHHATPTLLRIFDWTTQGPNDAENSSSRGDLIREKPGKEDYRYDSLSLDGSDSTSQEDYRFDSLSLDDLNDSDSEMNALEVGPDDAGESDAADSEYGNSDHEKSAIEEAEVEGSDFEDTDHADLHPDHTDYRITSHEASDHDDPDNGTDLEAVDDDNGGDVVTAASKTTKLRREYIKRIISQLVHELIQ